ncbi:hypothetical protein [Halalkalibacter okhensis]|uniref:Uncharacterized protein n=1 Tax=Halalkalibacter okhensis TaxID=333138 RepID=A0A0B0IG34_9BACI|nr:hypothetical protein [Halalkalibacter okhensis]KHF40255.1 hypothetical protein LQ50_10975 [Halalkalibacter okhensis]
MIYFYIPIIIFIIGLIGTWKKESKGKFMIALLVQVGFLTFIIQHYISYSAFLFGVLSLFTGLIAYYFTHESKEQRIRYTGLMIAVMIGSYYTYTSLLAPEGISVQEVEKAYYDYVEVISEVPKEEDKSWVAEWGQAHYHYFILLDEFYLHQTYTNRLLGFDFIATEEELEHIEELDESKNKQHDKTIETIFQNFYNTTPFLSLIDNVHNNDCYEGNDVTVCKENDHFNVVLHGNTYADHRSPNTSFLLSAYFLIHNGENDYYVPYDQISYSSEFLSWEYEGDTFIIEDGSR